MMPYTRKEVRFLESKVSPLSAEQKEKMNEELHENPALGHKKKGSAAMKRGPRSDKHSVKPRHSGRFDYEPSYDRR